MEKIRWCKHSINEKFCQTCLKEREASRTIPEKILGVLQATMAWMPLGVVAEKAGLAASKGYSDVGRAMRLLIEQGNPIDMRRGEGWFEYRLLPPDEADAFWEKRSLQAKSKAALEPAPEDNSALKARITELEAEVANLRQDNEFLREYIHVCDSQPLSTQMGQTRA